MPRLFTAIEVPVSIAQQLALLQCGLPGARWIERENLHITLRFIGDIENPMANELIHALERVKSASLSLKLENLDVFGGSKPHSLFASVKRNSALLDLQGEQERICQSIGLEPEGRKYKPHVTIARIRGAKTNDIAKYLSGNGGFQTPSFSVDRFVLLSSRSSVGGGPYGEEVSYQLTKKEMNHGGNAVA